MKCVLCKDLLDQEHPSAIYGRNPETFRQAWMHLYCFDVALETLKEKGSKNTDFDSQFDEYISRFQ